MMIHLDFSKMLVKELKTQSYDAAGLVIPQEKSAKRLRLVQGDSRFDIAVVTIKKLKFKSFSSAKSNNDYEITIEDGLGNSFLLKDIDKIARQLHVMPDELIEKISKGGVKRLVQQARSLSCIFKEMESKDILFSSQLGRRVFDAMRAIKSSDNQIIKLKLNNCQYILDKNKHGIIKTYRFQKNLGAGATRVTHSLVNLSNQKGGIVIKEILTNNDQQMMQRDELNAEREYCILTLLHNNGKIPGIQFAPIKFISNLFDFNHKSSHVAYFAIQYDSNYKLEIKRLFLKEHAKKQYFLECRLFHFIQLLNGLKVLKENGIMHGDIKPSNILIKLDANNRYLVDIADFEGATSAINVKRIVSLHTPFYVSILDKIHAGINFNDDNEFRLIEYQKDVFAMGLVLYKALNQYEPFPFGKDYYVNSDKNLYRKMDPKIPQELQELVENMLEPNYKDRLTALDAYNLLEKFILSKYPHIFDKFNELRKNL